MSNRQQQQQHLLSTITDDMFVVETPSFILPFIFEKPPKESMRSFVNKLGNVPKSEDSPEASELESSQVEKFLMSIGSSLVHDFVFNEQRSELEELANEDKKPYYLQLKRCSRCNFASESIFVMQDHLETVRISQKAYVCHVCKYEVENAFDILVHMKMVHKISGRTEPIPACYQCHLCFYDSYVKRSYERHVKRCLKKFRLDNNLEIEWETPARLPRRINQVNKTNSTCEICDADIPDPREHFRAVHNVRVHPSMFTSDGFRLQCVKCGKQFFTDDGLDRHLIGYHGLVTPHLKYQNTGKCPLCGLTIACEYLKHFSINHRLRLEIFHHDYKCKVCKNSFGRYQQFESHVYRMHGPQKID